MPYLPVTDFEGDDRIIDGDSNGIAVVDMGVDEFLPTDHKGDFDSDGCIELYDFVEFAGCFGSQTGDTNYNPIGDFDDNGEVELYDFVEFAGVFGTCY